MHDLYILHKYTCMHTPFTRLVILSHDCMIFSSVCDELFFLFLFAPPPLMCAHTYSNRQQMIHIAFSRPKRIYHLNKLSGKEAKSFWLIELYSKKVVTSFCIAPIAAEKRGGKRIVPCPVVENFWGPIILQPSLLYALYTVHKYLYCQG